MLDGKGAQRVEVGRIGAVVAIELGVGQGTAVEVGKMKRLAPPGDDGDGKDLFGERWGPVCEAPAGRGLALVASDVRAWFLGSVPLMDSTSDLNAKAKGRERAGYGEWEKMARDFGGVCWVPGVALDDSEAGRGHP